MYLLAPDNNTKWIPHKGDISKSMSSSLNLKEKLQEHYKVFIDSLSKWKKEMENMVKYVSLLDVLITKAHVAKKYNYCFFDWTNSN